MHTYVHSSTPLPPPAIFVWIGLTSVGDDTVKYAAQYVRASHRAPFYVRLFVYYFDGGPQRVVELNHLCEVNNGIVRITQCLW